MATFTGTTLKPRFYDCKQPQNHTKGKRKGREQSGAEKKKGSSHSLFLYYPYTLEKVSERKIKIIAAHRLRRLNRGASFSKIQVDIITAFSDRQARDIEIKSTLYPEYNEVSFNMMAV